MRQAAAWRIESLGNAGRTGHRSIQGITSAILAAIRLRISSSARQAAEGNSMLSLPKSAESTIEAIPVIWKGHMLQGGQNGGAMK